MTDENPSDPPLPPPFPEDLEKVWAKEQSKTFSFSNFADQFDTHIEQSIRGYSDLRTDVVGISKYFVERGTQVLDIGCSEGTLIERIADANQNQNPVDFIGCEINTAFKVGWDKHDRKNRKYFRSYFHDYPRDTWDGEDVNERLRELQKDRFYHDVWERTSIGEKGGIGRVILVNADILDWLNDEEHSPLVKHFLPKNNLSLVVSLFTMQFLAERHRLELFKKIYDNLVDGGAFITSEKIFAQNAKVQNMLEFLYYDYKKQHFSEKEILDKEEQLRFLAKLTTENLLMKQLRSVGFRGIQIFWRNFNFIGVLAMKRPKEELDDC